MKTILAVDDSATMREMVAFVLESAGYRVIESRTALRLDRHDDHPRSGHHRPKHAPWTAHAGRSLRELRDYKSVPILLLTTESSDTMKAQGRAAGATGWLVKPFDPATLLEVVQKVLR